jgi:hypothetical protein
VADAQAWQWRCAGNVPGYFGTLDVGLPLLIMEVVESRLTVRLTPEFFARLTGVAPLIAEPRSGLTVTTKQGELSLGQYIYFRLPGGRRYRLWTPSRRQARSMLSCLADAGFEVP